MAGFTAEEKRKFRFQKYLREHIGEFFICLLVHVALTELVVFLCGGGNYARGAWLAVGYTVGKWAYELNVYKKDLKENG